MGATCCRNEKVDHIYQYLYPETPGSKYIKSFILENKFPKTTGILLLNDAGVVISCGILSCPSVSECFYAIGIVVIEEFQRYFIKRCAVIRRTPF